MKNNRFAQSASELAIFGAILIFIIGLIARSALNSSLTMNMQIKAIRLALSESYRTAQGQYSGSTEATARNSASVMIMQDRLSVAAGSKTGSRDRIPMVASASATMSHTLYDPPEFKDARYLPIMDIFVNGQRFPVTTAAWETYNLNSLKPCDANYTSGVPYKTGTGSCWLKDCVAPDVGCAILYKQVGNYAKSADWCETCNDRFDYDFDGTPDNAGGPENKDMMWQWVPVAGLVDSGAAMVAGARGIKIDKESGAAINTSVDVDGDKKEEFIFQYGTTAGNIITSVDVLDYQDGDLDMTLDSRDNGRWYQAEVVSGACADPPLDPSTKCSLKEPSVIAQNYTGGCSRWKCMPRKVGIDMDNIQTYSFTSIDTARNRRQTTFLRIEEGKLFDSMTGQYVRDTNRQDQTDIFERALYLTKDTKRFCNESGTPTEWPGGGCAPEYYGKLGPVCGMKNPVEACNNCFTAATGDKTCMETDANIIFVRSRIADLRGRRWVRMFSPTR